MYTNHHMIHTLLRAVLFTVVLFAISTSSANAYFTTGQKAFVVPGSNTVLFLIDYNFGSPKHEVLLPVYASQMEEKKNDHVSYQIRTADGVQALGKTTSMVLSNASINTQSMYVTPKGAAKKYTLAVFFTPASLAPDTEYQLQVTHLPFNFDGTQQLQLNPSELDYYTTKLISLD